MGYTIADLPTVGVPAPGALPVGVTRYRSVDGGSVEAWVDAEGKGYLRVAERPEQAVLIEDAAAWEEIGDSLDMKDAEPDDDLEGKAADVGGVSTPTDLEEQNGIMIAFVVPEGDAADLALDLPTALPPSQLHMTLAFLGSTDEVDDEGAYYAQVLEALRDVGGDFEPITATVSGVGRFTIPGDADAFYYSVDAPELPELRQGIVEALEENGLDVSREHGFTPHITLCYLKEGEDNPIRRAEPKVLSFDSMVFFFGDQRVTVKLGGQNPDEEDAEFLPEMARIGYVDSTAPAAMPDSKAKPNPFARNGKNKIGKRGGPPIASGAWVSWGNQRGRVDLVVTNGKVPGVEEDITGTAAKPAARVVVYSQSGNKWTATGKKVGVSASSLKRSFPLTGGSGKKALDGAEDGEAGLVAVLTDYYEHINTKEHPVVDPEAVVAVYERGLDSWPGEGAPAQREQWALGRTKAFLTVASGGLVAGYEGDRDLLPDGHPLAVKAAPMLTVEAQPQAEQTTEAPAEEVAEEVEEKVALTVATGEHLDAETVRSTIDELLRFARPTA